MSWPLVKLDDLFDIARGGSPRPIQDFITNDNDGINWISISDASKSSKYIDKTKKKIKKEGLNKSRLVNPGDFLLTNSMSFGHPYIMRTYGCIHDGWLVLSPKNENIDTDYFYHLLGSKFVYKHFCRVAAGAVVKNLNIDLVKALEIPLPPLNEQKRIAAILDKADSLRRKNQQAIQLADQFLRAVFLDMFGNPLSWTRQSIPLDWEEQPIGKIAHLKRGYDLPIQSRNTGKVPIYAANGQVGYHDEEKAQGPGVITGRSGTLGKVLYSKGPFWPLNTSLYVTDFFGNEPRYIQWFLKFYRLDRYHRGAGVPTLNRNLFLEEISFVPPKELQAKFVGIFDKVSIILSKLNDSSGAALFDALSQKAFAGEL